MTNGGLLTARRVPLREIESMRDAFRAEMNGQIVHDSIHYRRGWTHEFALAENDRTVGYASVAVDGPWRERPTFYELYIVPDSRLRARALFDAFLGDARPQAYEVQSSDVLSTTLALTVARDIVTEKVVFRDYRATTHVAPGATLRCVTPPGEIQRAIAARQGGGEWLLELEGVEVGKGGILFHYNVPYGDVYMDINEPYRRRGFGTFLVQELKRLCYELGAIPAARCDPTNEASGRTLQKAGFLQYAHILTGSFR